MEAVASERKRLSELAKNKADKLKFEAEAEQLKLKHEKEIEAAHRA